MKKHIKEIQINKNLKIVLREWNNCTPYVVHKYNISEDCYYQGTYCWNIREANSEFEIMVNDNLCLTGDWNGENSRND